MKKISTLMVGSTPYSYYNIHDLASFGDVNRLPFSLKIILENLYRHLDGKRVTVDHIKALLSPNETSSEQDTCFYPARVLMQDFTGVPAVVDLAAMRDATLKRGGNAQKVNPLIPVDLVIDHSVMVDHFGQPDSFEKNVQLEYERNLERYTFLRWGQKAFQNFRVVPPGTGICHQVNLEYLAQVVWTQEKDGHLWAYPDTLVGTDSHTTMVNGLSVLGWGVGGIEAEAAMLGQPLSMVIPKVVGVELQGALPEGATATDLVLTITHSLRKKGVVGKFVEFYGSGVKSLSLADRATIANMAPEYGATCGFFPIDEETINFLRLTGRLSDRIRLVEAYAKAQGLWLSQDTPRFDDTLVVDLNTIQGTLAGPKRPQDKMIVSDVPATSKALVADKKPTPVDGKPYALDNHHVVIAAITSCTNTSNPSVMIGAGLLAKKAHERGLKRQPWVKTSLAPGSQVVTSYLEKAGLLEPLNALGFNLVGYGCTTCIGNSGPLDPEITSAIEKSDLTVAGVLSGNRNFEGRINPHVKANYLASPPLVVAYALAGTTLIDFANTPIGSDQKGTPVFLKDIWPTNEEISKTLGQVVTPSMFQEKYAHVFDGDAFWQSISAPNSETFSFEENSTYVKRAPYFDTPLTPLQNIKDARILALLGDSITTDHISPAGNIKTKGPAGLYLAERGVEPSDFNSFGARRGNHEVMVRGTFANIRLQNEMMATSGGITRYLLCSDEEMSIYDAAMKYQENSVPLVIVAGKEYGTGSSRDWAAKGTQLLGVKAVIAESFERIHRSNLVGMGVLPLEFTQETRKTLGLTGTETVSLEGLDALKPGSMVTCIFKTPQGQSISVTLKCRIDTQDELAYFHAGGILPYVLNQLNA
jgi:aconitate hydratase